VFSITKDAVSVPTRSDGLNFWLATQNFSVAMHFLYRVEPIVAVKIFAGRSD
jgi:hypothetical protein